MRDISAIPSLSGRFDRARRVDWLNLERIGEAKVFVAGAGAVGNECLKNLALSGFRRIELVDMDCVEETNLNRCVLLRDGDAESRRGKAEACAERLSELVPGIEVRTVNASLQKLPESFLGGFDLVLGCVDNLLARLHLNAHACHMKIPYIDAATDGFLGKVQVVLPKETACLECGLNSTHMEIMEKRFSCTGRSVTFAGRILPAEITTTSIVAAVQVREALKMASGKPELLLRNIFYYDGKRNSSETLTLSISPDCPNHG